MARERVRIADPALELPSREATPLGTIARRLAVAVALVVFVALIAYADRGGYTDPEDGHVSLLDAFYYSTVSITTTGYGDIRPVSDGARLLTTVLVTPARVLFLILLVGTTLEVLAERSRQAYRLQRWRRRLRDHVIICGFGTKGRMAATTLLEKGMEPERIVAIDPRPEARADAKAMGIAVVAGDSSTTHALAEAGVADAQAIVVAVDRDDSAVLTTLTARELNDDVAIVAAVREEENAHLLHQGGAQSVIISSSAAGRLLGMSTHTPRVTEVLEDLMQVGSGLDIVEREARPEEVGPVRELPGNDVVVAIVRGGELLRFDDPRADHVEEGDRLLCLCGNSGK